MMESGESIRPDAGTSLLALELATRRRSRERKKQILSSWRAAGAGMWDDADAAASRKRGRPVWDRALLGRRCGEAAACHASISADCLGSAAGVPLLSRKAMA